MRKKKMQLLLLTFISVTVIIFLIVGNLIYNRLSRVQAGCAAHPDEAMYTPAEFYREGFDTESYLMPQYEEVTFYSRGSSIRISAFYISAQGVDEASAPSVIVVHGINDCKRRPHSLLPAGMLNRNGFNVLVMDMREHGDSEIEDGRMSAGTEEYLDVLGAWDWLKNERNIPAERIGLFGYSLGAATSMIAMGEDPRIAAVWEDSGYADINDIIQSELSRAHLPAALSIFTGLASRLFANDDLLSLTPLGAVARFEGRPFFIVHGEADARINYQSAYQLAEVYCQNIRCIEPWITSSRHIESMFDYAEEYEARLVSFFRESLGL